MSVRPYEAGDQRPPDPVLYGGRDQTLRRPRTDIDSDDDTWQPLPSPQARLCFLHQLDPHNPSYNVGLAVELHGAANPHVLRAAVSEVDRRHAALRSRFGVRSGTAAGTVDRPVRVDLPIVVLHGGQDLTAVLAAFARRPFDLSLGRPYRWCLVTVSADVHVLVLVVHHIVFDGSSVAPLVDDLEALVRSMASGRPVPAVPLLHGDGPAAANPPDRTRGTGYWRSVLADLPPAVDLWPAPERAPGIAAEAVPAARWTLEQAWRQRARELARRHRSSVPAVLLACLAVALSRYTGRPDVVIGVPVDLDEGPPSIGHRVNVLPVRLRISRQDPFDVLLSATREALLGALEHRHTPFEEIVDVSGSFRGGGASPLFQVLLSTVSGQVPPRFDGLNTRLLQVPTPAAKYALEIAVTDVDGGTQLSFEADPDRCPPALLDEFAVRLREVVEAALSDPRTPVARIAVERPDRGPVLARRRATRGTPLAGRARGLYEVVQAVARACPDRTAVRAFDGQLSYAALDRRARLVAHALRGTGAAAERVVAVCVPRGLSLPVAVLGAARTGAAPLLLDSGLPDERLRAVLRDSGAVALLGSADVLTRCGFDGPALRVEHGAVQPGGLPGAWTEGPSADEPCQFRGHPEQAAYVLATSGSTGRPKFVVLRRDGFGALLEWTRATYDPGELAEVLALTSVGFDLSVFEFFAALSTGGTVALVRSPGDLAGDPALRHATLLNTVPSVLETLLDLDLVPTTATCVNVAGEPLEAQLVARLQACRPNARIRNLYGPTEATTYVTSTEPLGAGEAPTIGRGIADVRLQVTDDDASIVPTGGLGELRIGGPHLARGYLGAPALTAWSFVPDSAALDGSRVYRSGDVVRATGSGSFHFLGRRDHQVKILGVRVELGEIRAHLLAHPAVQEAVVISVGEGRERLLVGCVGAGSESLSLRGADLAAWLRPRVPESMIPRQWVVLDRLPLTSNGKVDRRQLADLPSAATGDDVVAPRSEREADIADCWYAVLGRTDIGVHDVFFDAGGNSLTLLLLHDALTHRIDPGLRLVDLFRSPTIAAQARMVDQRQSPAGAVTDGVTEVSDGAARGSARRLARNRRPGRGDRRCRSRTIRRSL